MCNGLMDSALACCADGPGSIPAVSIGEPGCIIKIISLPLLSKVTGKIMEPDTIIGAV